MIELKEIIPITNKLSLLYIDEDYKVLSSVTKVLKQVFLRVDDAENATVGLSYAKINNYDLIIIDSASSVMNVYQLLDNLHRIDTFQNIIVTTKELSQKDIIDIYKRNISSVIQKPFTASELLDEIVSIASKLLHDRNYLEPELEKLNQDLMYERKRIGRFMVNEKKLNDKIKLFTQNIQINRNIHELTKLPSKYALNSAIGDNVQSLIYINIDHFDFINNIYGMAKANKLLIECAKRLGLFLPKNAEVFHITADEFVILLDDPAKDQDILLARQIQALFKEAPLEFDTYSHSVVFSIGIDRGKGKQLFVNAKYASKESRYFGGNQITIYSPMSEYMKEQKESLYWIEILRKAFDDDKIFTYYQPIINNSDSGIKHYEVLCRLMDDNNKLVDASKFIHSARLVGLITQITRTVIDKSFKVFQDNEYNFSLNISMHDLHESYLEAFLVYKCEKYNIDPNRVYLEIVEDIIFSKSLEIDEQIGSLKEKGFHVVIDDFGSDKSTYNRMFDLEAEFIKIDGSFIRGIAKNEVNKIIVQSIVDFAKKSGMKTIAEHVENPQDYDTIKELGIEYSQGFFLGKPSLKLK